MSIGWLQREACPVCRASDAETLYQCGYRDPPLAGFIESYYAGRVPLTQFGDALYRLRHCLHCGLVFQDPVLDDAAMEALYETWIDSARSLRKKQHAGHGRFRQYAGQLRTLTRLFAGRNPADVRVLDYGMGWGYWSRMAQAHGFDVSGYELSAERCAHARDLGVSVIERLPPGDAGFDFILASQVFEHLPEPSACLDQLVANLASGGVIHLRVPDGRGTAARLRRAGWSAELDAVHPLEHINCFTRQSLLRLADAAGLVGFAPPLRLEWGSLWGGLRREINDRLLNTHLYLRRR